MINIKLGDLQQLVNIFKPMSRAKYNVIFSLSVLKIIKKLEEEAVLCNEMVDSLRQEYCVLDEQGNPVPDEQGLLQFEGDNKDVYLEKLNELLNTDVEMDCPKIGVSQIANENIKISPEELAIIEEFIEIDV